jgi:hypothetical protein
VVVSHGNLFIKYETEKQKSLLRTSFLLDVMDERGEIR